MLIFEDCLMSILFQCGIRNKLYFIFKFDVLVLSSFLCFMLFVFLLSYCVFVLCVHQVKWVTLCCIMFCLLYDFLFDISSCVFVYTMFNELALSCFVCFIIFLFNISWCVFVLWMRHVCFTVFCVLYHHVLYLLLSC